MFLMVLVLVPEARERLLQALCKKDAAAIAELLGTYVDKLPTTLPSGRSFPRLPFHRVDNAHVFLGGLLSGRNVEDVIVDVVAACLHEVHGSHFILSRGSPMCGKSNIIKMMESAGENCDNFCTRSDHTPTNSSYNYNEPAEEVD